jgi:hypothetical protein
MTYQPRTEGSFYLLSILEFNVGTPVTLYGTIEVTTEKDLSFVLSKDLLFDPKLLPAGEPTKMIDAPFGMSGVQLKDFEVNARIYKVPNAIKKDQPTTKSDLRVNATARFTNSSLSDFELSGAIVFENASPRLALVSLSADKPLTITQFVQSVIGGTWGWMDGVADQFAILGGDMYFLKPRPSPADRDTYTYEYKDRKIICSPGYGVDATLRIFQSYDFKITLTVESPVEGSGGSSTIHLIGSLDRLAVFDFIILERLSLEISTKQTSMSIGANVRLLGADIGRLDASYDTASRAFGGVIQDGDLLPAPLTSVAFSWSKDAGFRITSIGGLPQTFLDILAFLNALKNRLSGGCQDIVAKWLNGLYTSIKPALNGSPSKNGSAMNVPLKLTYEVWCKLPGRDERLDSGDIDFSVSLQIPDSLAGLPEAIGKTIIDINNAESIAGKILSNPRTYKAIAIFVGMQYGKQALARMICRALDVPELKNNPDTAKDIAKAETEVPSTLEDAAELAAQLTRVALLDVVPLVGNLVGILGEIASILAEIAAIIANPLKLLHLNKEKDEAEERKKDAQRKIQEQCQTALGALNNLLDEVERYRSQIQIEDVELRLEAGNVYVATWRPASRNIAGIQPPVVCMLALLDKDKEPVWSSDGNNPIYADQTPYRISMGARREPVLYASVTSSIGNLQLLDVNAKQQIRDVAQQLQDADAQDGAKDLRKTIDNMPDKITTVRVLSATRMGMIIGNSFIGKNTFISRN